MRRLLGLMVILLAIVGAGKAKRPAAVITPAGALTITLPADLLDSAEVKEQLTSGLTTVFVISGSAHDRFRSVSGGMRLEVRYDLWEEKYLISVIDPTGSERKLTLDSQAAFERWWTEGSQLLVPPNQYDLPVDVEVKLTMLPFSAREEADTKRWLSRTLSAGGDSGGGGEQAADALRIIVETSIARRPLLVKKWSARAERQAR